ncbi:hypothetical protein GCM10020367_08470 [Streptomyces sannanensis]|uniref:DUF8017 domain-containing protein n=1 Tax=Streptomyces sannanensis TaxID=285536 RepID=A0ABP6S5Q5_9ACTN
MWPGQQPPGGEQNPQDQNPNPYQQPGYQQPNPYQQPGYQQQTGYQQPGYPQPDPYQQPTAPQYAVPEAPQPQDNNRRKTAVVAVVAATAVVAAAVVTGVVVLKDDDKGPSNQADPKPSATATTAPSPTDNPRGDAKGIQPVVAGWKVVVNPKWGTAFDVPQDWEVSKADTFSGFEDKDGKVIIGHSAPAYYKSKWCTDDEDKDGYSTDTALAGTGTKGADGAKSTEEVAENQVAWWVYGAFTQPDKKPVKTSKAKPYTTKSGITGSVATAWSVGADKTGKCDSDGKAITFGFKNAKNDFVAWSLYSATGVDGEVPEATIQKILSTVRLAGEPTES